MINQKIDEFGLWAEHSKLVMNLLMDVLSGRESFSILPFFVDIVTPETVLEEYRASIVSELKPWFSKRP